MGSLSPNRAVPLFYRQDIVGGKGKVVVTARSGDHSDFLAYIILQVDMGTVQVTDGKVFVAQDKIARFFLNRGNIRVYDSRDDCGILFLLFIKLVNRAV